MRPARWVFVCALLSFALPALCQIKPEWKPVIGTWEGDSTCTVPSSPCHDEHVLFRVKPARENPDKLEIEAFKIVDKKPVYMGTLPCEFAEATSVLTCTGNPSRRDLWMFNVSGDTMSGTLTTGKEKTLYRKIELKKK
jgi:hypothetical protein